MLFADETTDAIAKIASDSAQKIIVTVVVSAVTTVAAFLFGRYWGRYKAQKIWDSKEFFDRVIISMNIFADGYLKIRTVMERSIQEVFLNRIAIDMVEKASKACTVDQPLLLIPKADRWYVLNFVLNAVAEHFSAGHVKRDAGVPVASVKYAIFLTCEVVGDERIRKVRAMLLRQDLLENFPYTDTMPQLENPWHSNRVETLRKASELYKKEPDLFLMIEVCV
ncbi:MAG: hypothetical protein MUF18_01470 [Fimbriiglobus sp.]|jgi:hypothetical protein|nr:hypothetical protein [Fimbriiglobus sp.]